MDCQHGCRKLGDSRLLFEANASLLARVITDKRLARKLSWERLRCDLFVQGKTAKEALAYLQAAKGWCLALAVPCSSAFKTAMLKAIEKENPVLAGNSELRKTPCITA